MPKLDLTAAKQIKGPMGEILALKGQGFAWTRTALWLNDSATRYVNAATINSEAADALTFTADTRTGQRYIVGFGTVLPVGTRVRCRVQSTSRMIVRSAGDMLLSTSLLGHYDGTPTAGVQLDIRISGLRPYFGFYCFTPGRTAEITGFEAAPGL